MMETKEYVGLLLTKIVELEGSGWDYELKDLVSGYHKVKDIDDLDQVRSYTDAFKKHYNGIVMVLSDEMLDVFLNLFKELRERQKKLEYVYFCCDKELNPSKGSSLQKFKAYENR
jgi:hypothetical protein